MTRSYTAFFVAFGLSSALGLCLLAVVYLLEETETGRRVADFIDRKVFGFEPGAEEGTGFANTSPSFPLEVGRQGDPFAPVSNSSVGARW